MYIAHTALRISQAFRSAPASPSENCRPPAGRAGLRRTCCSGNGRLVCSHHRQGWKVRVRARSSRGVRDRCRPVRLMDLPVPPAAPPQLYLAFRAISQSTLAVDRLQRCAAGPAHATEMTRRVGAGWSWRPRRCLRWSVTALQRFRRPSRCRECDVICAVHVKHRSGHRCASGTVQAELESRT